MLPGQHVVVFADPLKARHAGLEVRDSFLILAPGSIQVAYLCRKPVEGTIAENVLKYGTGAINIDACRIRTQDNLSTNASTRRAGLPGDHRKGKALGMFELGRAIPENPGHPGGRWPPNVLLVHGPNCQRTGTREVKTGTAHNKAGPPKHKNVYGARRSIEMVYGFANQDGLETVPAYECQPDCPVRLLDGQSGTYGDSGSASRFFPQFDTAAEVEAWLSTLTGQPVSYT